MPRFFETFYRTLTFSSSSLLKNHQREANIFISPDIKKYGMLDNKKNDAAKLLELGLAEIRDALKKMNLDENARHVIMKK